MGCILTPEQTEGPYYIDADLLRADITEGKEGVPLQLTLMVQQLPTCQPIANALVEIWHCDALGVYSGFTAGEIRSRGEPPGSTSGAPAAKPKPPGGGPPSGSPGSPGSQQQPGDTERFWRGGQMTDADGRVTFQTIFPGWYTGRTTHIHFKVRTTPDASSGTEITSQLYFDDALTDRVHAEEPYAQKGPRNTRNDNDGIFRSGGAQLMLDLTPDGDGYVTTFGVGLQAT